MEWTLNKSEKVYSLMPASLHQSVTKNQTTEIFLFCRFNSKKEQTKWPLFFELGQKKQKKNNFNDLGLGFWSQIDVMKRALHMRLPNCKMCKRQILHSLIAQDTF